MCLAFWHHQQLAIISDQRESTGTGTGSEMRTFYECMEKTWDIIMLDGTRGGKTYNGWESVNWKTTQNKKNTWTWREGLLLLFATKLVTATPWRRPSNAKVLQSAGKTQTLSKMFRRKISKKKNPPVLATPKTTMKSTVFVVSFETLWCFTFWDTFRVCITPPPCCTNRKSSVCIALQDYLLPSRERKLVSEILGEKNTSLRFRLDRKVELSDILEKPLKYNIGITQREKIKF